MEWILELRAKYKDEVVIRGVVEEMLTIEAIIIHCLLHDLLEYFLGPAPLGAA